MKKPNLLIIQSTPQPDNSLVEQFAERYHPVIVRNVLRGVAKLQRERFAGIFVEGGHLDEALQAGQFLQYDSILNQLPDGILMVDRAHHVYWANRQFHEWVNDGQVIGKVLEDLLGSYEVISNDPLPLQTAYQKREPTVSTLRGENHYFQMYACPHWESCGELPEEEKSDFLILVLRDITTEYEQQRKLVAIHRAGIELANLSGDDLTLMTVEERVELLKDNILHFTRDLLKFDVIEIRLLEEKSGKLEPLLTHNMKEAAAQRSLYACEEGNGVTGWVAATGRSYLCEDTRTDGLYLDGAECGALSSLTVPLFACDEVVGTFNVESPEVSAFSESDLQFLEVFARDVAAALHTLELLTAEKIHAVARGVEAIHGEVARPIDEILNDAVTVIEKQHNSGDVDPAIIERLRRIVRNARDIKVVIQEVGRKMTPSKALPSPGEHSDETRTRKSRVLVVDKEEWVRDDAHRMLEPFGYVVETAHNGEEALSMASLYTYDVIISDIKLPDMSGYRLLCALQERLPEVPMILVTGFGYDAGHSIVKARQAGLKSFLYKPFQRERLISEIEDVQPLPGQGNRPSTQIT
ncbi:Two-component system response regulator [Planctomycetales bacterium 10988]|nr:Two-component system response regulator [Planctomycetales bacterium 10988]